MLREVLAINRETGSRQIAQSLLEVAAGVAAVREDWPRVGAWYGAAQAQMHETGLQRDAADEASLAPHVANARAALGDDGFAAAERSGAQRSRDGAIDDVARVARGVGVNSPTSA